MDGGGRLWTIMGFYAGLRAVCVVAKGLTGFSAEMPCFTAQCQTFDQFFRFCRALVDVGNFYRGCRASRAGCVKNLSRGIEK